MRWSRSWLLAGPALPLAVTLAPTSQAPTDFPHERHARVFPVCEGCHEGIVTGSVRAVYPGEEDCRRCHDGRRQPLVAWRPPAAPRVSNLRFSHAAHRDLAVQARDSATCLTCHAGSDPARRMVVAGPNPERCVQCHAHRSVSHLSPTASCRTCHVPVAAAQELAASRIRGFPKPGSHDSADFLFHHGGASGVQAASCAVCHARESCERCHANADRVSLITGLARDRRIAELEAGRDARYDAPASHADDAWRTAHGQGLDETLASCANCHTRPSCERCHAGGQGASRRAILALPGPGVRAGLGVDPSRIRGSVHAADIAVRHGSLAASGSLDCAECHAERICAGCHTAQESKQFHAADFVERHAADVFTSSADCQTCHNTQRFCLECHRRTGLAAGSGMSAAFHTGQAMWILSHGQAARTGMESCAACHQQNDCVRCHSAVGGWGVNPHRPGFRANAIGGRNSASCRWCHLGTPPGGSP